MVIVGGSTDELPEYCEEVVSVCQRLGHVALRPVAWRGSTLWDDFVHTIRATLERADVYIGVYGQRYGRIPPGEKRSTIEIEFECALERGLPMLLYWKREGDSVKPHAIEVDLEREERFREFMRRAAVGRPLSVFRSVEELGEKVARALSDLDLRTVPDDAASSAVPEPPPSVESEDPALGELLLRLCFRLVVERRGKADLLEHLSARELLESVRAEEANVSATAQLAEVERALAERQAGIEPSALWLAWAMTAQKARVEQLARDVRRALERERLGLL